jgi:hypothetical protein
MCSSLRNVYNGPVLKGSDAAKWDANRLAMEQHLVQSAYKKLSPRALQVAQLTAKQSYLSTKIGAVIGVAPDLEAFKGDIRSVQDRWTYGMEAMGRGGPGKMPTVPNAYSDGTRYAEVTGWGP